MLTVVKLMDVPVSAPRFTEVSDGIVGAIAVRIFTKSGSVEKDSSVCEMMLAKFWRSMV